MLFLLVPLALADAPRLRFYAGLALYAGTLKWLGWIVFTRGTADRLARQRFPVEIFLGLALVTTWFYLRALLARVWPGSFVLFELRALPLVVVGLHLLDGVLRLFGIWTDREIEVDAVVSRWTDRASVYFPYALMLSIGLAIVSGVLFVQGTDAVYNGVLARFYLREGLHSIAGGPPAYYPSGYGATIASAMAMSPLTMVQAVNLQHVFLAITALALVTCTIAHRADRPLWFLHALVVPYLGLLPVYCLFPYIGYEGVGRQVAPSLVLALLLLPLWRGPAAPWQRLVCGALQAALCLLAVVLNPAAIPFAALAAAASLVLWGWVPDAGGARGGWRAAAIQLAWLILASVLYLSADMHTGGLVRQGLATVFGRGSPPAAQRGTQRPPAVAPTETEGDATGQTDAGLPEDEVLRRAVGKYTLVLVRPDLRRWWASVPPLGFTAENPFWVSYRSPALENWHLRLPQRGLPGLAALLTVLALGLALRAPRAAEPRPVRGLAWLLAVGWTAWFVSKYAIMLLSASLSSVDFHSKLLALYLRFVLLRSEVLLTFAVLAGALALVYVCGQAGRASAMAWPRGIVATACALVYLSLGLTLSPLVHRSGYVIAWINPAFGKTITPDDVALVRWMDEQPALREGLIGLAAAAGKHLTGEPYLYSVGGSQAVPLYSRYDNYCFDQLEPRLRYRRAEYEAHVQNRFDADWCLQHNIRWFFFSSQALDVNPGLARAIADGQLEPMQTVGQSAVYRVVPQDG